MILHVYLGLYYFELQKAHNIFPFLQCHQVSQTNQLVLSDNFLLPMVDCYYHSQEVIAC